MSIYQGSTPKYLAKIKNDLGIQLDPSNVLEVIEVRVWISNALDGTSVAKFIYPTTTPPAGWRAATVKTLTTSPLDRRVMFTLTAAETRAAQGNQNDIQVETTFYDEEMPDNKRIEIGSTRFGEIKNSQL